MGGADVASSVVLVSILSHIPLTKINMTKLRTLAAAMLLLVCGLVSYASAAPAEQGSTREVKGKVLDTNEEPLMGVAVVLAGTTQGVTTDLDGTFSMKVPAGEVTLEFLSLGYSEKKVVVPATQSVINVYLTESATALDATVVVGYGTTKKVNLTGAVSVVESESIQNRSAANLGQLLQGTVPGLNITTSSGRPGQGATLNIRGLTSINSSSPYVLVDGVEGDLSQVNPNDVESISVIKDASSAAIYGARASAGVILVTTKSGSEDDGFATVRYSGRMGFTAPTTSTDWETRGYYSVYLNNLFFSSYAGTPYATYSDADMQELWARRNDVVEHPDRPWVVIDQRNGRNTYNYYANTDWWHYMYNDIKPTQNHSISFSGGTKRMRYFLSGNYNREQGMFRQSPDVYQKYNLRSRLTFDVTKWLQISNNTSYFSSKYNYPGRSGVNNSFASSTVHALASFPTQNPDGSGIYTTDYNGYQVMDGLAMLLHKDLHKNVDKVNQLQTTVEAKITPIKQLEIVGNYSYYYYASNAMNRTVNLEYSQVPGEILTLETGMGEDKLYERVNTHNFSSANVFATYSDTYADAHNLKIMVGANYEQKNIKDVMLSGYNLFSETLNDMNLIGNTTSTVNGADYSQKRMETDGAQNQYATMGFFGRLNYDYKGKYLFELSGRYDGTSRFPRDQRWGFFPSASAGWRVSEENFFAPVKDWWNNLKIRYSYGSLGNQQVGYYDYIREIGLSTQSYLFGGTQPLVSSIGNPVSSTFTWETVNQHNLGLDMGFLSNRLSFTAEAYIRDTKNMLTTGDTLPATYGASSPMTNNADLRTKGYELSISWKDMFMLAGRPFEYSASVHFNDYITHITRFNNPDKLFSKSYYEGMTYGEIWGYTTDGYFATDEEAAAYNVDQTSINQIIIASAGAEKGLRAGDIKYVDLDGDGKITTGENRVGNPGDRRILGNSKPRYQYGINLGFNWMGFDFSVFFQGIGKIDWYPGADARSFWGPYARPYMTFIPKDFHTLYWTEENPDAYFPRPRGYIAMNTTRALGAINDRYLQNIGYCRLKNLTFGYSLPQSWMKRANMDGVRIYFTGENLAYWAPGLHSDYIDPEMAMTNGNLRIYPWQKTFMFGVDITF